MPWRRSTRAISDHSRVACASGQLLSERTNERFQLVRAGSSLGDLSVRFGELLVRDRPRHVIRDSLSDRHISPIECVRAAGPETKSKLLVPHLPAYEKQRTKSGGPHAIPEVGGFQDLEGFPLEVIENHERVRFTRVSGTEPYPVVGCETLIGSSLDDGFALPIVEGHRHPIVRKHLAHNLRDPCEHASDIEHRRERSE